MRTHILALALVAAPALAQEGASNFAQPIASRLQLGEPIQTDQVILFPLLLSEAPPDPGVDALWKASVSFEEPKDSARQNDVLVRNRGDRPVLVPAGTLLEGGRRDRMIANDLVLAPGAEAVVRALPAASTSDIRTNPTPFELCPTLAPIHLRRKGEFDFSDSLIPTFVARWLEFRDDGDKRKSLIAISESTKLSEYSLASREKAAGLPTGLEGKNVVGAISAVRGRAQMLTVFGSNALLAANFDAYVRSATFVAAAIELRAKAAGVPLPGKGNPEKTLEVVRTEAYGLLEKLKKAIYEKDGDALVLRLVGGTRGRAVAQDGKLVHLTIYPYDPVEARLYAATVDPDSKPDEPEEKVTDDEEARPPTDEEDDFIDGWRDRFGGGRGGGRGGRR
jgi:hypothetical protein